MEPPMKKFVLATAGLLAALLAATLAVAQTAAPRHAERGQRGAEAFAAGDSNHDGRLSLAEFERARSQRIAEQFRKLDLNADGGLTQDEMRQSMRQHRKLRSSHRHERIAMRERLRGLDANGDQALTRAEIGEKAPKLTEHFADFDLDRDGRLTRDEIRAGMQALRQAR
jgi:Ca2+-binding EF-hand superfamily protein